MMLLVNLTNDEFDSIAIALQNEIQKLEDAKINGQPSVDGGHLPTIDEGQELALETSKTALQKLTLKWKLHQALSEVVPS